MKKLFTLPQLAVCAILAFVGFSAQAADVQGSADAGRGKVWLCIGCHSIPDYRADYPFVYKVPMMRAIATSLSDQDMADIGEYYAAQTASSPNNPLK